MLFHRQGLIDKSLLGPPRAVALLKKSAERQREVGDKLYDAYSRNRTELIAELHFKQKHPLDEAIEMAQRLFDRIIFIAFCEDRQLVAREDDPQRLHRGRLSRRHQSPLAELQEPFPLHRCRQRNLRHSQVQRRAVRAARGRRNRTARHALDDLLQFDQHLRLRRRGESRRAGASLRAVDHRIGEAQGVGVVRRRRKGESLRRDAAIGQAQAAWHLLHAARN